jgi:hypothetical protein
MTTSSLINKEMICAYCVIKHALWAHKTRTRQLHRIKLTEDALSSNHNRKALDGTCETLYPLASLFSSTHAYIYMNANTHVHTHIYL